MFYDIYCYKSLTSNTKHKLVHIEIFNDRIKPVDACECGFCQNDGTICGYFEGLIEDATTTDGGFVARCSKGRC